MNDETLIRFALFVAGFFAGAALAFWAGLKTGLVRGWERCGMAQLRRNSILAQMRRDARTGRYKKLPPMPERVWADHLESKLHTSEIDKAQ